jgi:hypothetical protein
MNKSTKKLMRPVLGNGPRTLDGESLYASDDLHLPETAVEF